MVVLQLYNYDLYIQKSTSILPELSSIRVTLKSKLECVNEEEYYLTQNVETGNGRIYPVCTKASVYPIRRDEIESFAREAGFTSIEYYSDYKKTPANDQSSNPVVIVK